MKKLWCAALIALCAAASLAAQTDTSAVSLLNVGNYSKLFLNGNGLTSLKYTRVASDDDHNKIADLSGDREVIDTPLEIALLSTCAGVVDVRPVEASNMLGNARQADLKLGAAVYQEMQMLRFLGNTDAVGRHEGIIKFITDRGNASRAEIESYYRQGIGILIAQAVDAEFNTIVFMIDINPSMSYNCTLTHSTNNQYVLTYESYFGTNTKSKKELTAASLNALSSAMSKSGDFSAMAFNTVRDNATLMPAVIFDGWKKTMPSMVNPYELLTKALADFYVTPNEANYKIVCGILARAKLAALTDGDEFTRNMAESIKRTLVSFNQALYDKVNRDLNAGSNIITAANIPDDPRYGIFALTKAAGDALFVRKSNPTAARQLTR
jgi:hypothetical protein